jgi:PAS domain S-box-containing protein
MKATESQLDYARIIANTVREPFVVLDKDFRVLAANRSFYKQFQLSREEVDNKLIYDLGKGKWNIPKLRRLLETIISECGSVEDYKIQISFETGDKILLINAHHIETELVENSLILLSIEDLTEHRQAEESLQIERGRLAATLKSIPDELWITDAQGNIIERSEAHIQYNLGKSSWPDVGTALQELELLNPDGTLRPPGNAALPRALRGEITENVPEMIRNLQTGELRWREVSSSPIRDEKGNIIGAIAIARDITERKLAEEELHRSEQRFRALATAGFSVVYRMSPDWSEMQQLSGSDFLSDTTESNRDWLKEYIPAQDQSRVRSVIDEAIRNKFMFELEHMIIRADGSQGWTHSRAVPLFDSKGEITEWFGAARDITENKHAEQALVKSQRTLEEAQRITHVGSWNWNVETNEILCSAETYRIYGEKPFSIQVTENIYLEYIHPEDRAYVKSIIADVKAGLTNRLNFEFRIVRKNGEVRHIHSIGEIKEFKTDGKPLLITGTGQDITERKLLEKKLAAESDFVSTVIQTSGALITIIDLDGTILRFNKACEELTGYTANEAIGRSVFDLFIPMEEREAATGVATRLFAGEKWVEHENHWITKNGEKRFIRWRNSILFGDNGKPLHAIATGIDITDRKRAEEALQTRTKELEIANRDLESFSYSVSHDLRSPLSVIQGLSNIILEEYGSKLDEHGKDILIHITDASNKMDSIMTDLLNLARISRENLNCHEIDLNPIVNGVIDELRQSEPQRNVKINIASKISAHADPKLMTIAFKNLIENAWKYTGKNPNARIDIGISSNGNKNTVFIQDNGVGFDMNFAQKIFQPFERLQLDSQFTGTGIGLAIVQRIIQRHGGKIWAESEIDKGSTFYFTLDCTG